MNKNLTIAAFVCTILLLNACPLLAQSETPVCTEHSCCGSNDPTPASVMISHVHSKNEWMFSYKYMNMNMAGIQSGTQAVDKNDVFVNYLMAPDKMRMDMHMLMGMYGVTDKLTVMAMLNYNINTMDMSMFTATGHHHTGHTEGDTSRIHHMQSAGVGDIKLNALYSLIRQPNHQLLLSAGVSMPIGRMDIKGTGDDAMYPNKNYPYAMQLGSGTYDILPCVSYMYQRNKITFSTQVSSIIRTGYNSMGYKLGNEATLNTWFAYQWLSFLSSSVRIEGNIADKINGNDPTLYAYNEPAAHTSNYGGQRVNCAIGSVFQIKKGFLKNNRLSVEYGLPVYQNLNGIQMKWGHTLTASLSRAF